MASRGVFGRADLLQALVLRPGLAALGLPESAQAESLAYLRKEPSPPVLEMPAVVHVEPVAATAPARPTLRPPLRMPWGWQAERVLHAPDEGQGGEGEPPGADGSASVPVVPLVRATEDEALALQDAVDAPLPPQRLRDALRVALDEVAAGRGRIDWPGVVQHLAQGRRLSRLPRVASPAWPGHLHVVLDDQAESMRSLAWDMAVWRRRLGQVMGDSRLVVHRLGRTLEALERPGAPGFDSVGQRWLILGDGRVTEPEQQRRFDAWTRGLRHRQHAVALRAPMPVGAVEVAGVAEALALLAMLGQVSTLLLRALCQSVPGAAAGLEWAVWNHPQVRRAGHHVELRPECLDEHVQHLQTLPAERLRRALARQRVLQRGLPETDLRLVPLRVARLAPSLAEALAGEVEAARAFFADMAREGGRLQGRARLDWALRVARLVDKTPDVVRRAEAATFRPLAASLWREAGEAGLWWLKLGAEGVRLDRTPDLLGALLLPEVRAPLQAGGVVGPAPQGDRALDIELASETVRVTRWERPAWAESFAQGTHGVTAEIRWPDGSPVNIGVSADRRMFSSGQGCYFSLDFDDFGPRISFILELHGNSTEFMVFRYAPAGSFLMGAADGEAGHHYERPQHLVILTKGFWLANTPCTWGQWRYIMGANNHDLLRSNELGHPVNNIDIKDVKLFLAKLGAILPRGCVATLPSEAQWEYAARAGTVTPFWWGTEDVEYANWGGRHQGTTQAGSYPPNPWGLYDMHGNVWEWCLDGLRPYKNRMEIDPVGRPSSHAVRGGSWVTSPFFARASARDYRRGSLKHGGRGFRVLLTEVNPVGNFGRSKK